MQLELTNYRSFLRSKLVEKQKKNPGFSLRAFSRQLGIEAGFLSYVLNGKRDISETMVGQFIEKLQLTEIEARTFQLLVLREKAKSESHRSRIDSQIQESASGNPDHRDLSLDHFAMISEWYHFAILNLLDLVEFDWSPQNAAKSLGISVETVRLAIERLTSLQLIEVDPMGRLRRTETYLLVEAKKPNEALRRYHEAMFKKNITALSEVDPQDRITRTQNIAFSTEQLPEARKLIDQCIRKLDKLSRSKKKSPEIYHVGFHAFPITQIKGLKGNQK